MIDRIHIQIFPHVLNYNLFVYKVKDIFNDLKMLKLMFKSHTSPFKATENNIEALQKMLNYSNSGTRECFQTTLWLMIAFLCLFLVLIFREHSKKR